MSVTVCLDAGHAGKSNRSPVVPAYYESDMNWKLHKYLGEALEQYGIAVRYTRTEQKKQMDVFDRGIVSEDCDLFLSIHSNSAGEINESIDRVSVYVQLDGKGDALGLALADTIHKTMETVQPGRIKTRQGTRGEYYGVLRGAASVGTMGMILEHSFHTNTRSTLWLMDNANLRRLAEAEAAVIAQHFGLSKLPPVPKITEEVIDCLAKNVLVGFFGNGSERRVELGSLYEKVQERVNLLLSGKGISK